MLGVIRFLLSFCVIAFHLTAAIPNLGLLAVNFFYVISGFLITLVLHETYSFKLAPFATNRFLRLYPAYFAVAGASLIFSETLSNYGAFHASWSGPATIESTLGNIFMFPWAFFADSVVPLNFLQINALQSTIPHFRLVPSTWSVGVEIVCYFLLWMISARRLWSAIFTILGAMAWQWYVLHSPVDKGLGYFPVPAALLPFGLGALAYHITKLLQLRPIHGWRSKLLTISVCVLFAINWKLSTESPIFVGSIYYYANDLLAFISVILINRARHAGIDGIIDKWLGDLAYPMFLGQYVFGFIGWKILGVASPPRGTEIFIIGAAITILASVLIVLVIDRRMTKARSKIRVAAERPEAAQVA